MTPHATALLTSLRTIAGAIGAAVFVAVMTAAAENVPGLEGSLASMYGVNMAFLAMTVFSVLLIVLAVLGTKIPRRQKPDPQLARFLISRRICHNA